MARVLVTGAESFTARYLVAELKKEGFEVHGLVRASAPRPAESAEVTHRCDLSDVDELNGLIRAIRPKYVVHLAAISFVAHENVSDFYLTNVVGTRNLLQALAAAHGQDLKAVILASSANVYGNATTGQIDEKSVLQPENDYAVSKLAMEHMARLYSTRLPLIIVRPFNYTGVGQSGRFLIPKIIRAVRHGHQRIELGNLDVARDFSDVRWVANVYVRLLKTDAAVGKTFNVCSGVAYALGDVLDMIRSISGKTIEAWTTPALMRNNEIKALVGNSGRLVECIGSAPRISLDKTLSWMLESPEPDRVT